MSSRLFRPLSVLFCPAALFAAAGGAGGAEPLAIERRGNQVAIQAPASGQRVVVAGANHISSIAWGPRTEALGGVAIRIQVRWGGMYDLYSLSQPIQHLQFSTVRTEVREEGGSATVVAEGVGLGARLRTATTVEPKTGLVSVASELRREGGGGPLKYQINYEVRPLADSAEGAAWVLPSPGGFTVLRSSDHSVFNVFDQDWTGSFPVAKRLPERWALLSSVSDGEGVLFSGDNLRHCRGPNRPDRFWAYLYGNDSFLRDGDTISETLAIELVPGVGGVSRLAEDVRAGTGGLLQTRYAVDGNPVPVVFTGSGVANVEAEVPGQGVAAQGEGSGTLMLDVSGLPDGEYQVVKRMQAGGRAFEGSEPLFVVREAFARLDADAARLRQFAQGFDPAEANDPEAAAVRLSVLNFKLAEYPSYRAIHHVKQMEALLADARRATAALEADEPANLPALSEVLYSNPLTAETDDFLFYGAGEIVYDPERGLYFGGDGTMNLWSRFQVEGSFMVEFDYMPLESPRGGTMFQMCGQHPAPNSDFDFMCTASWGGMSYYMFGVRCYHFSFGVTGRECRLRKTGEGFYILSDAPDPVAELDRWHRLAFAKDGNRILFIADGRLVQEYFDEGHQGPVLEGGRIGIRNWSGHRGWFRNLAVRRLGE